MKSFAVILAAGILAMPAQAAPIYSDDFDGNLVVASGVTATFTNGSVGTALAGPWNVAGWSGNFFSNRTTGNPATASTLTLTGLAPNSQVIVSGILAFLDSWDSYDGGCCSPDYLNFSINGISVATMTSNNALGSIVDIDGATPVVGGSYVQADNDSYYYSDFLVDLSTAGFLTTTADGTGTFTLSIWASGDGWQGGGDEGWGLDKLSVQGTVAQVTHGVPEPASWAMMIAGLSLAGLALRRRTTRVQFA